MAKKKLPPLSYHAERLLARLRRGFSLHCSSNNRYWLEPGGKFAGVISSRELIDKGYLRVKDCGLLKETPQSWEVR